MNLVLRPIGEADTDFLLRVYGSTREDELNLVAWSDEQKAAFVQHQFHAQHSHYQTYYGGASFDVIEADGEPVGRLYVARWPAEIRIVDIALLPAHRGRGIGGRLIRDLLAEGDAAGTPVSIHVEQYNPAQRLYRRLGFEPTGEHGVYLLMVRPVNAPLPPAD